MSKIIGPSILYNFDFEFVDKSLYTSKKPLNNTYCVREPSIMVTIKKAFK